MLKRTITYMDFNDEERTEDFYFHLSKAELMELEMSINGGLSVMISRIIATKDNASLVKIFKDLILKSYGVKSIDGKRFIKSEELTKEFTETEAYSILFTELATDADKATEFVNGIIPSNIKKETNPVVNNVLAPLT